MLPPAISRPPHARWGPLDRLHDQAASVLDRQGGPAVAGSRKLDAGRDAATLQSDKKVKGRQTALSVLRATGSPRQVVTLGSRARRERAAHPPVAQREGL